MKILTIIIFIAVIISQASYSQNKDLAVPSLSFIKKSEFANKNELYNFKIANDTTTPIKSGNKKAVIKSKIVPWKLITLGAVGTGIFTAMHVYYRNTWWKDYDKYFKFAEDGYYARDIDKISHIYTANAFTVTVGEAYNWAGISPKKSLLYGAITSMVYETYIEINDGFAPNWGFDWIDMGANIFGAVYPFLQNEIPVLKNFNFKWSFKPAWIKGKVQNKDDLLDDYTNMTFWMSISPEGLLPKSAAKYYPGFLAIAVGLSIKNASHSFGSTNAFREWFLSLDYDINKLPGNSDFMKKLKKILNFYHFPAPAVRVSPSGIWYGLYF